MLNLMRPVPPDAVAGLTVQHASPGERNILRITGVNQRPVVPQRRALPVAEGQRVVRFGGLGREQQHALRAVQMQIYMTEQRQRAGKIAPGGHNHPAAALAVEISDSPLNRLRVQRDAVADGAKIAHVHLG